MRPTDHMKKTFKELHVSTSARLDAVIDAEIAKKRVESQESNSAHYVSIFWRITMRSRIGRIAIPAIIVIAVMVGLNMLGGPGMSGVVWAEVLAAVEQAPTVVYNMSTEIGEKGDRVYQFFTEKVYNGGPMGHRIDSFREGNLVMQKFLDFEGRTAYRIRNDRKAFARQEFDVDNFKGEQLDPRQWVKVALSEDYQELGSSQINGIEVEGIEVQNSLIMGEEGGVVRIWVDKGTNLPVKMELTFMAFEMGAKRPMRFLMEDFQWNLELSPGFLKFNIPADYQELDSFEQGRSEDEEQKPPKALTDDEKKEQSQVKEVARLFFQACSQKNWTEILKYRPQDLSSRNSPRSGEANLTVLWAAWRSFVWTTPSRRPIQASGMSRERSQGV